MPLERRDDPDRVHFAGILQEELRRKNMSRRGLATATRKLAKARKDDGLCCPADSFSRWSSTEAHDGRVPSEKQLLAIGDVLDLSPEKRAELLGCFYVLPAAERETAGAPDGVSEPPRVAWHRRHRYRLAGTLAGILAAVLAIFVMGGILDGGPAPCPAPDGLDGTIGLALRAIGDERCGFTTSLSMGQATISCPDWWLCHVEMVGRGNVLVVGPMEDIEVRGDMTLRYRPSYGRSDLVQDPCAFAARKAYPNDLEWRERVVNFQCS